MDAKMNSYQGSSNLMQFDFLTTSSSGGVEVPIIYNQDELDQQSTLAAFVQLGNDPNNPSTGVDWIGFMTQSNNSGMGSGIMSIDSQIRSSLSSIGSNHMPQYSQNNTTLNIAIVNQSGYTSGGG